MPCEKCGKCCNRYPCDLTFDELPGIAKRLDLGIVEFFEKYLLWDYYIGDGENDSEDDVYFIVFRRKDPREEKGKMTTWEWAFQESPCIFLTKDNLCSIHEFKPETGRRQGCDADQKDYVSKKAKAESWRRKAKELGLPANYHEFNVEVFYKIGE